MNTYTLTIDGDIRPGLTSGPTGPSGRRHVLVGDVHVPADLPPGDAAATLLTAGPGLPLSETDDPSTGALLLANGRADGGSVVARASDQMRAVGLDAALVEIPDGGQVDVELHTGDVVQVRCIDGALDV